MNTFKQQIDKQISDALKSGQTDALSVLRDIKSQIVNGEKENKNQPLDEAQTFKVLEKMVSRRKQSIDLFIQGKRTDLADKESFELGLIESYLPKKLSIEEVKDIINKIISDNGFKTKKEMGLVIKKFNEQYAGKSDGKTVSDICKEVLV